MKSKKTKQPLTPARPAQVTLMFRPHPWHGLEAGSHPPEVVNAYIEITPFDLMKYEIDKTSGYLRVDRPQRSSALPPALYGFIPRTFCGDRVGKLSKGAKRGDGDPLDICVLSERPISRNEVIVSAKVIGGLSMIDRGEADDKIIAVVENDYIYGKARDLKDVPPVLLERIEHYFSTYKIVPGQKLSVRIGEIYGRAHAIKVVRAAIADYQSGFAGSAH